MRGGVFAVTVLAALSALAATVPSAEAQPAPSASSGAVVLPPITIAAVPAFGAESTSSDGWTDIVVRVESIGSSAVRGTLEAKRAGASGFRASDVDAFVSSAPFSVAPGQSVVVRLPTHAIATYASSVAVRALDEGGVEIASATVNVPTSVTPLVVDVEPTPKLAIALRAWPMAPMWSPGRAYAYGSSSTAQLLATGGPVFDKATGDPILPDRAAEYAPATVVVMRSDVLARLAGVELEALVDWIAAGGALAVVVTRPEDLRAGTLASLVGGAAAQGDPPPAIFAFPAVERPPSAVSPFYEPDLFDETAPAAPVTPIADFTPVKGTPPKAAPSFRLGPLPALRDKIVGYSGGNLRPSPFGATATYGLGEVHLLAFDPTTPPALDDGWAHGRMLDLTTRAWDRRAALAFPLGSGDLRATNVSDVRKLLDPNENFRVALGISAILLVVYSILAGPLTYIRATKRGRPLDPLVYAPMWSAIAFGVILFVGLAGKGFRGRARRIALVEAGAGMQRGAIRRYRGLFSSQTRQLSVRATDRTCVLDTVATDSREHGDAEMRVDRDGARLENLTALPWQTVVVAEDAMFDLPKGGVSIIPTADGSVDVANHSGRALAHVVVWVPRKGIFYFPKLDDGASLHAATGRLVTPASSLAGTVAGGGTVHALDVSYFTAALPPSDIAWMTGRWAALAQAAGAAVDWFPDDAAAVMGEIVGGEGVRSDAGLSVEKDDLLLRVVGEGGAP